jgi:hypothetical protein
MSKYFTHFPKINYLNRIVTDITSRVKIIEDLQSDPYAFLPYTIKGDDRPEDIAYYYYGDQNKVWLIYLANQIIDPYTQWPLSNENFEKSMLKKYNKGSQDFVSSNVNTSTNSIFLPNHKLLTSDPVIYTALSAITGLVTDTNYYVIRVDESNIKLASNAANSLSGVAISLTGVGGNSQKLTFNANNWLLNDAIRSNIKHFTHIDKTISISPDTYFLDQSIVTSQWTKVKYYDYEIRLNDDRRTIWLVNSNYADQLQSDLEKVMND